MLIICLVLGCISGGDESTPTTTSPTTTLAEKVNCTRFREEILSGISDLKSCSEDNECAFTAFPCPFGCMPYNQMNDTSAIEGNMTEYGRDCGYCSNNCAIQVGYLLCDNLKCVPSITKLELKSETGYHSNETIIILLENQLNRSIYLQKCDDLQLELRAGGRWNTVAENFCPVGEFIRINPLSVYEFNLSSYNLSLERYRVKANAQVKCLQYPKSSLDCQKNVTLYSPDFRIKD